MVSKSENFDDPLALFFIWMAEAEKTEVNDPNAAALATADDTGYPNARMVLVKGIDEKGFVFYTNLDSQKGRELAQNARAALCFHWKSLERQVRIRGKVKAAAAESADGYFKSRPKISKIGAWASKQSQPLESKHALEKAILRYTAKFAKGEVPRPDYWSGFRIVPEQIEFWQAGKYRLHKRILFSRDHDRWTKSFLYP